MLKQLFLRNLILTNILLLLALPLLAQYSNDGTEAASTRWYISRSGAITIVGCVNVVHPPVFWGGCTIFAGVRYVASDKPQQGEQCGEDSGQRSSEEFFHNSFCLFDQQGREPRRVTAFCCSRWGEVHTPRAAARGW